MSSPYPWISDKAWKCVVDLRDREEVWLERLEKDDPSRPMLVHAAEGDRQRAPTVPALLDAAIPPEGDDETQAAHLRKPGAAAKLRFATWPICCSRLATLVRYDELTPSFEAHFLEAELREGWGLSSTEANAATVSSTTLVRPSRHPSHNRFLHAWYEACSKPPPAG